MFCNFSLLIFVSNKKKINGPFIVQEKIQIKHIDLPVELVVFIDVPVVADCGACVNDTLNKQNFQLNEVNPCSPVELWIL